MCRAIREFHARTGIKVGFKPAGGIRAAKDSLTWLCLMKEELGTEWTKVKQSLSAMIEFDRNSRDQTKLMSIILSAISGKTHNGF